MSDENARQGDSEDPIEDFSNCHLGIVQRLQQLAGLPALADAARQARRQATELLEFFQDVVENHHSDEERELFPAVLRVATPGTEADRARELVRQLTGEHRALEKKWAALRPQLKRIANGSDAELDAATVAALVADYQAHARLEEEAFLPLAMSILRRESNELAALGLSLHIRHLKTVPGYV